MGGSSPRENPCGLQMTKLQEWGYPHQLELKSFHPMIQILDIELQDLMFVLVGFGLVFNPFLLFILFFLFGMVIFTLFHCIIELIWFNFLRIYS
jgi:hypothetical protein